MEVIRYIGALRFVPTYSSSKAVKLKDYFALQQTDRRMHRMTKVLMQHYKHFLFFFLHFFSCLSVYF